MKTLLTIMLLLAATVWEASADIIFILDRHAANRNGHIAVLIGSEKSGWRYVSINGTGTGAKPWGVSVNQDIGTLIVDTDSNIVREMRQAIRTANHINPLENHHYDMFRRIECGADEDFDALIAAKSVANAGIYGIFGPGQSCIDVAQAAFASLFRTRTGNNAASAPGASDWVPRRWFDKLDMRIRQANTRITERIAHIRFHHQLNKKNRTFKLNNLLDAKTVADKTAKKQLSGRLVRKIEQSAPSKRRPMYVCKNAN